MQEDPAASAATDLQASADLLARLAEAEALLAAERASNQALSDELLRLRSDKSVSTAAAGISRRDNSSSNNNSASAVVAATEDAEPPLPAERARRRNRGNDERPRPPWQNVLYKRQPYADNHVPDSFLEKLVTNGECHGGKNGKPPRNDHPLCMFGCSGIHECFGLCVRGALLCVQGARGDERVGIRAELQR